MGISRTGSRLDHIGAGIGEPVGDVGRHGVIEQEGVLIHHGHLLAQAAERYGP